MFAFTYDRPFHKCQIVHESNRAIWENVPTGNCVPQLCLMTEPSEVRPIPYHLAAMLIMLKYLICLSFLQCCCFSPFVLTRKSFAAEAYTSGKLQDYENIHGSDFFYNLTKSLVEVSFHFHLQLCKNILEWLLSYEVSSCKL